ncbi:MAG: hypothetical protein AB8B79_18890 [Granulosicoccus sp.]
MDYQKPDDTQMTDMLQMFVGPAAKAKATDSGNTEALSFTALYINGEGDTVATCSCDMPTAAALGGSLSMIPMGGVEGMVEDNALTEMATDNLYEVMNILSSLLMSDSTSHLKLSKVEPDTTNRYVEDGSEEAAYTLDLGNYGPGELIFNFS